MSFEHISLVVRVLCKLHNMRIDDFLVKRAEDYNATHDVPFFNENVIWKRGNAYRAADIIDHPRFTDRTREDGVKQGARTDREVSDKRRLITESFRVGGIKRPEKKKNKNIRRV